jgi:hypothetical protein
MADLIAGYKARRTVPYKAVTAYWESHSRWLVDPLATGIEPGSVGRFSLQRRWQPAKEVSTKDLGFDVTLDQLEQVEASVWYSQKTMEAHTGGSAGHAPLKLKMQKRSRKSGGAVLAIPGGQYARLLYPERIGKKLQQLVSADPPQWNPNWCLVHEVWTSSGQPAGRILVSSANISVSVEGTAGVSGVAGGTLGGGRIGQISGGAQEKIHTESAVMLSCWRVADKWIKRVGKQKVERPDGSTYDTAEIAYNVPPERLREVSPVALLTEVTVPVLNADLGAVIAGENAALAAIGIAAAAVARTLASGAAHRTESKEEERA